jgi:3-methyladenine DNA glycosylase AlkD
LQIESVVASIRTELEARATPERAEGEKRYLKSDLEFLGATVPMIRKAAQTVHRAHTNASHSDLDALVSALWVTGVFELRMAAVELLALYRAALRPEDIELIERLLRESKTWALVDNLSAVVVGDLVERFPHLEATLDRWAGDDDFWMRRSALLAHLTQLRDGGGDFDRFTRYADAMLEEKEFFIRKAIGWVLRDTARRRPGLVAAWVAPRTHRMSGVTIREAVKRLPADQADALLEAYREKRPAEH